MMAQAKQYRNQEHPSSSPSGLAETQSPWNSTPATEEHAVLDIDSPDFEDQFTAAFVRNVERALSRKS